MYNSTNLMDKLRKTFQSTGQFINVKFEKADGTARSMTFSTNVKKYLKGGVSTTAHKPELLNVYDQHSKGYRSVNLSKVWEFTMDGKTVVVNRELKQKHESST